MSGICTEKRRLAERKILKLMLYKYLCIAILISIAHKSSVPTQSLHNKHQAVDADCGNERYAF
jgi:hypothetical protein